MESEMVIVPVGAALGARVEGVDLARNLDEQTIAAIRSAFLDHQVLVFPGQDLDPESQIRFTSRFGAVEPHPLRTRRTPEGFPEVMAGSPREVTRPGLPQIRT